MVFIQSGEFDMLSPAVADHLELCCWCFLCSRLWLKIGEVLAQGGGKVAAETDLSLSPPICCSTGEHEEVPRSPGQSRDAASPGLQAGCCCSEPWCQSVCCSVTSVLIGCCC